MADQRVTDDRNAWPKVRILQGRIYVTFYPEQTEHGMDLEDWQRLHARLGAALSATSPLAQGGAVVRVAVAFDEYGDVDTETIFHEDDERTAWDALGHRGATKRAAILTATIPAPVVPEIAAAVTAQGGE